MTNHSVNLLINMYERTYRKVLVPGFFPAVEKQNCRSFANRIAIINNVDSRKDAASRAELLLASGEIDRYFFVADHIDQALAKTGLANRGSRIGRELYKLGNHGNLCNPKSMVCILGLRNMDE